MISAAECELAFLDLAHSQTSQQVKKPAVEADFLSKDASLIPLSGVLIEHMTASYRWNHNWLHQKNLEDFFKCFFFSISLCLFFFKPRRRLIVIFLP